MGSRIRRRAVAAIISVIGLVSLPNVPAGAWSGPKPPALAAGTYRHLPNARLVNAGALRGSAPRGHLAAFDRSVLVKNHGAPALSAPPGGGGKSASPRGANRVLTGTTQGTVLEQLTVFPGIDISQGVGAFGADNNMEPPDTQIAVGPTVVVEMVNANMSVWSKSGTRLAMTDLNMFYGVYGTAYTITDPRLLYDASSGRFIASALAVDRNTWNSQVFLAVSQTSDPTGLWLRQALKTTSAVLMDQPKVGTSDDKMTVVWSEWLKPGCDPNNVNFACFAGEVYGVVDKFDMLGSGPAVEFLSSRDPLRYAVIPAHALSSTTTQYMAYNNADPYYLVEYGCGTPPSTAQYWNCPSIGVITLTGSVHANTLSINESQRPINSTTAPPGAAQLNNTALVDTGDDRLLTAVWQNNQLWMSATDGNHCPTVDPAGTPAHACALVIAVQTDTNPMKVVQDAEINPGDFAYHPAISLDNAGDAFVIFSRSSSTMFPSTWVTGLPAATGVWSPLASLAAGTGAYESRTQCGGLNRWGDYSGASVDGGDPTDVWVAGEYAAADIRNCTWKTAIGRLTYTAPTVTSITPATGPGGTAVTITGTNFLTGNTTPYFGATPSGSGTTTVLSPNSLTTTAPPGSGWVLISAATPDGHGPAGPTYKYPRLEAAPGTVAAPAGATGRGNPPPPVPQKSAGPRPAFPLRLFRLLLL